MESVTHLIQKFFDTYLLPAVASTFIGILYFSYKCDGRNSTKEPLTISRKILPGEKECIQTQPTRLNGFCTLIPHATESLAVAIQIQSEVPNEFPHKTFQGHETLYVSENKCNAEVVDRNALTDPESFCKSLDQFKTSQETEPTWDYYDVIAPLKVQVDDLKSEKLACEDNFAGGFRNYRGGKITTNAPNEILKEDMLDSKCCEEERWFSDNEAVGMNLYGKNYWQFVFE